MQPGDTLVFWIEAHDRKPAANNVGRSASLAIAVAAPELAKLNLSDLMPNEMGRFLLSERQIIIHTEKLHAERARLAPAALKTRAGTIAAEQRDFKNSFNDYIKIEGEGEAGPGCRRPAATWPGRGTPPAGGRDRRSGHAGRPPARPMWPARRSGRRPRR